MGGRRRSTKGKPSTSASESSANSYYEVVCPDGHTLMGLRSSAYQALRCPECGNGVFVLPRSPLPEPPRPTAKPVREAAVSARPASTPANDDDAPIDYREAPAQVAQGSPPLEIVWDDQLPASAGHSLDDREIPEEYRKPQPPREARPRPVPRPAATPSPEQVSNPPRSRRRPRPDPATVREHDEEPANEVEAPVRRRRSRVQPSPDPAALLAIAKARRPRRRLGWVILGVIGVTAATFAYRTWQSRLEALPKVADENWSEGRAALEIGEFDSAKQKLTRAVDALEKLGGRDERLPEARQLSREAALLADRINLTLEELLDEAVRQTSPEAWATRFETLYQGRSVVIDTTVEGPPPAGAEPGAYPLSYRVLLGRGPRASRVGRIDLSGFRLFADQSLEVGAPVLFGARLAGVELDGRDWRIRLEPDSGVILTQFKPLQLTDWEPDQSSRTVSDQPRLDAPLQ